jgi:hypothetical protein
MNTQQIALQTMIIVTSMRKPERLKVISSDVGHFAGRKAAAADAARCRSKAAGGPTAGPAAGPKPNIPAWMLPSGPA